MDKTNFGRHSTGNSSQCALLIFADGSLRYKDTCLQHKCPGGYTPLDSQCVRCNGTCPSECDWRWLGSKWITPEFLRNESNHNCTKIVGNVRLPPAAFEE